MTNPFLDVLVESIRKEGTPQSMAVAHDVELIASVWEKVVNNEAMDWHNTACEFLIRGDTQSTLIALAHGEHDEFETILFSSMVAWFYTGYLLGEGNEHIAPCRCDKPTEH